MIKSQEVLPLKQHFSSPSQSESLEQSCVHDAYLLLRGTFGQTPCLVLSRHIALNKENNPTLGGSCMYHNYMKGVITGTNNYINENCS